MAEAHVESLDRTVQRNAINVATGRDLDTLAKVLNCMARLASEADEAFRSRLKWGLGL